ncbi:retrovirus-related Pol polyprotein from transposon opus [Trichonephila clavipes]|nr:retrovirus-related Pol polyprotein from transposon opus [Trichonephila clavipes]
MDIYFVGIKYSRESIGQLVIPKCRRTEVLKLAHRLTVFSSHMGPKKTLERIKYSFFWEGLRADVKKFCESCKEFQLTRSVRIKDRSSSTPVARPELPFEFRSFWEHRHLIQLGELFILFHVFVLRNFPLEQSSRLLTVAIIVCSVCGFSVSRFVNFLFLVSDMVKSATRRHLLLGGACKEQLPAPGNRSNERRYREKDLWQRRRRKRSEREIRERVTKKAGVVKSRHG